MSTFKGRGIILKEFIVNDSDKVLTILFKDKGKFSIWAKNNKSIKSKLFYEATAFSYGDFIIYDNGKNLTLNQLDLIERFYSLTDNLDKLAYGTYFLELTDKSTLNNIPCNEVMLLLLKTLNKLSKTNKISPRLIAKIFDLKLLQLNGYMPNIENCCNCFSSINTSNNFYFSYQGLICEKCKSNFQDTISISQSILYTLNYIFDSSFDNLYKFNISESNLNKLALISKKLIDTHFDVKLKSQNFIDQLKNI